jgi:hypothetical protein
MVKFAAASRVFCPTTPMNVRAGYHHEPLQRALSKKEHPMQYFTTTISIRLWLVLVLSVVAFRTPQAAAQFDPVIPDPVPTMELLEIADTLELSEAQQLNMLTIHETYREQYRAFQDLDVKQLQDDFFAMIRTASEGFMSGGLSIPPRNEIMALVGRYQSVMTRAASLDRQFFAQLGGICSEEQQMRIPFLQQQRELRVHRNLLSDMLGDMNAGARVDLRKITNDLELEPSEQEAVDRILINYEQIQLGKMRDLLGLLIGASEPILDLIDELGLRDRKPEELFMAVSQDQSFMDTVKNKFDEASKPIQLQIHEISQMNLRLYRQLREVLPENMQRELRHQYYDVAYGDIYWGQMQFEIQYGKVIKSDLIDDETRTMLTARRDSYRAQIDRLVDEGAAILDDWRTYRTFDQLEEPEDSPKMQRVEELEEQMRETRNRAEEELLRTLGDDLLAEINKAAQKADSMAERPFREAEGDVEVVVSVGVSEDGTETVTETRTATPVESPPDEVDTREARRQAIRLLQSFALPEPMNAREMTQCVQHAQLDDFQHDVAMTMYDEYRTAFLARLEVAEQELAAGDDEERTPTENSALRKQIYESLTKIERGFFEDLAVLATDDDQKDIIRTHQLLRDREVCASMVGFFLRGYGSDEGYIDIVRILADSDLAREDFARIQTTLKSYEQQAGPLTQQRLDAAFDADRRRMMMDAAAARGAGDRAGERILERWRETQQNVQRFTNDLIILNRNMIDDVSEALGGDRGWQLRYQYNKTAFPDVFEDARSAEDLINDIRTSADLTDRQRQQLEELMQWYRAAYFHLSEEMVSYRKNRNFDFSMFGIPDQDVIDSELMLERLRLDRRELNDQARLRLGLILTDDQRREYRKLLK